MPYNGQTVLVSAIRLWNGGPSSRVCCFAQYLRRSARTPRADANYFTVDGVSANFGVTGYFLGALGAALALVGPGAWSVNAYLFGWKRI